MNATDEEREVLGARIGRAIAYVACGTLGVFVATVAVSVALGWSMQLARIALFVSLPANLLACSWANDHHEDFGRWPWE